jgi:glutamine amidotransferase
MIGVVDIGLGNIGSIYKLLNKLKVSHLSVETPADLARVEKVIFPGVGSFAEAASRLDNSGLKPSLQSYLQDDRPYLGICLGMQLLAERGEEVQASEGLGHIKGTVRRMTPADGHPLPHIGWNNITHSGTAMFDGIAAEEDFYFVHSYFFDLEENVTKFTFEYGGDFTAYVEKGNVRGAQFHPEKSQAAGLKFVENFLKC